MLVVIKYFEKVAECKLEQRNNLTVFLDIFLFRKKYLEAPRYGAYRVIITGTNNFFIGKKYQTFTTAPTPLCVEKNESSRH